IPGLRLQSPPSWATRFRDVRRQMNSLNRVFVHLVWATWDREAMLSPDIEEVVHACIADRCRALKCQPLEIGGTDNHVHVLVRMALTVALSEVVHDMKGASSHMVNKILKPGSR